MHKYFRLLPIAFACAVVASAGAADKYPIGLQLYTVRDQCAKDFPATLKAVGDIGFDGVEFAGYYGRSAEDLKKMLDEDHLKCFGSHVQLDDLQGDKLEQTVAFNKTLGNHLLVVPWIPDNRRNTKAAIIETAHMFNDIAKKLKPYGMYLGYHDHSVDFQKVDGDYPWSTFFANSDPDVYIQFDIGNALEGGVQALPFLTKYPGRVISVHVKDFSKSNPNALLGEGDENWSDVMPVLKGKRHPKWYIIEQESYPFPSLVCAQKCLETFKKMLAASP